MTERLYYNEPYRASFEATVISCAPDGNRYHVVLDRTAFYPTSGGQPFDIGRLDDAQVIDVIDEDDGRIVHVTDTSLPAGARVTGSIDWPRRFDHMQQHTGQHVLSAAFDRLFAVRTESFHLGAVSATIDLAREVTPSEIRAAETESNRVVWDDRPVTIKMVDAADAAALPLRKESLRAGPLRLVGIEEFDLSACGGTHVSRTGAIGIIAIAGWEKFRGGTRIEFVCGGRALDRWRLWRDALAGTTRHLSVTPAELPAAIERLQAEAKAQSRLTRSLQEQLAEHHAASLVQSGERVDERIVVVQAIDGWDAAGLKSLASAAVGAEPHAAVVLFTTSSPAMVVVAAGAAARLDASSILKSLTTRFGGKGGGKPQLAQGGGLAGSSTELVAEARRLIAGG
jgi:alanyl-tRNA synthetase